MYMCRIFHRDRPEQQVDARLVAEGCVTIGRDPAADWPIEDPKGTLSRVHCSLHLDGGELLLCDSSTNGTYLDDGERLPRNVPVPLEPGCGVRFGELILRVDPAADHTLGADGTATMVHLPAGLAAPMERDWPDAAHEATEPKSDASLMEAFCAGAGLDSSAFSGEDPERLMRRLGEIYRETVAGLTALMQARTRLKGDLQLDRTTIAPKANNPLRWTPNRRLAQDLLAGEIDGFLAGPEAVRTSFEDLARHLTATAAGANAAVSAVVTALSPRAIQEEAAQGGFSLKSRAASCWDILERRYDELTADSDLVSDAFKAGYTEADASAGSDETPFA